MIGKQVSQSVALHCIVNDLHPAGPIAFEDTLRRCGMNVNNTDSAVTVSALKHARSWPDLQRVTLNRTRIGLTCVG